MALTDRPTSDAPSQRGASAPRGEPPYNWRATGLLVLGILLLVGVMAIAMELTRTPTSPAGTLAPSPTTAPQAVGVTQPQPTAPSASTPQPLAPQPLVAPTRVPTPAPVSAPGSQSTAAPTQAPTSEPAATATPVPGATLSVLPPNIERLPTPTPGGFLDTSVTTAEGVDQGLADEVIKAYTHYWQVRSDAFFNLDVSHLPDVMADRELAGALTTIDQFREQGRAVKTLVDHQSYVVRATQNDAEVLDKLTYRTVDIDIDTKAPVDPNWLSQSPSQLVISHFMRRSDDEGWKVIDEVRRD